MSCWNSMASRLNNQCRCAQSWRLIQSTGAVSAGAAEVIPPKPARHFNDYANVVDRATAQRLDRQLEDFEKQTSNQILVVVYPKMQSDSSIEDYTVRVAQKWGVGQKGRDNGAVLFVFLADHKMFIDVGYGLEGALPDALAKQIIERELRPRFRQNDFAGGLSAAINAMMSATKGEYKALPQNRMNGRRSGKDMSVALFWIVVIIVFFLAFVRRNFGSGGYYSRGRYRRRGPGFIFFPGGGGWGSGGGGWGGGGGGSWGGGGGGGGFSSGGGSFGGGGAAGSW
jgi:uncharacterized protein